MDVDAKVEIRAKDIIDIRECIRLHLACTNKIRCIIEDIINATSKYHILRHMILHIKIKIILCRQLCYSHLSCSGIFITDTANMPPS